MADGADDSMRLVRPSVAVISGRSAKLRQARKELRLTIRHVHARAPETDAAATDDTSRLRAGRPRPLALLRLRVFATVFGGKGSGRF